MGFGPARVSSRTLNKALKECAFPWLQGLLMRAWCAIGLCSAGGRECAPFGRFTRPQPFGSFAVGCTLPRSATSDGLWQNLFPLPIQYAQHIAALMHIESDRQHLEPPSKTGPW